VIEVPNVQPATTDAAVSMTSANSDTVRLLLWNMPLTFERNSLPIIPPTLLDHHMIPHPRPHVKQTIFAILRSMKTVYFACSIRGGRDDQDFYAALVDHIKRSATVLTEAFSSEDLTADGTPLPSDEIWQKDIAWVKQSDAVIAEATNPSLGVGYEVAKAEEWGMPVLALFRETGERKLSAMIDGAPGVTVVRYREIDEARKAIDWFLKSLPDTKT
jgi:hypothetical protein